MQGRKLILADGTEYDEGEAGYSDGHLWLYLPHGTDMAQAFSDFSNVEKTEAITFAYGESRVVYEHYTDMRGIVRDVDDGLKVHLMQKKMPFSVIE